MVASVLGRDGVPGLFNIAARRYIEKFQLSMSVRETGPPHVLSQDRKLLEVIVTSPHEAREAEDGGADRLELVRSLEVGGLTPTIDTVQATTAAVQIPVRVMLREADSMSITGDAELNRLVSLAKLLSQSAIAGLVLGFVREGSIDERTLTAILSAVPSLPITFHRAFEHVHSPQSALATLKRYPQVDRILIRLGDQIDLAAVRAWQICAGRQIRFIVGLGLRLDLAEPLRSEPSLGEIHVGRAVREPETVFGAVSRVKVADLKSALA